MSQDRELFSDRMLEGEYTTWRFVWQYDIGIANNIGRGTVDNVGTVYCVVAGLNRTWVLNYAGAVQVLLGHQVGGVGPCYSNCSKYVLVLHGPVTNVLDVWRSGALLTSINLTDGDPLALFTNWAAISPNGKFIIIVHARAAVNYRYVQLWEGI